MKTLLPSSVIWDIEAIQLKLTNIISQQVMAVVAGEEKVG